MIDFNKIKGVIFDLDGLIIDSEPMWDKTDTELLRKRGHKYTDEERKHILGSGQKGSMGFFKERFGLEESLEDLISERLEILREKYLPHVELMEGADRIIRAIGKRGIKMALATGGHKKETAKEILGKHEIEQFFSVIVGIDEVKHGKPHPEPFLKAAKQLGVAADRCLVLEDSPNGVRAGKAAGMSVIGVNQDLQIREDLERAGADEVFSSLADIQL